MNKQESGETFSLFKSFVRISLSIIFLFLFIMLVKSCIDEKRKGHSSEEARIFAEEAIMARLKSPSTADISFDHGRIYFDEITKSYIMPGYVDAQNSFGATVRQYFEVIVQTDGSNKYRVISVSWK